MNKLYCVPLGSSARQFFINEIEQQGWDKALLVLPSGVLQKRAYAEGAVRVKNFDDIAGGLLNANGYTNLKRISRRTQELIVEELLKDYAAENQLPYFNVLVEKKGFVKAVTGLMGQLSRSGAKMEEIYEALNSWDRQGKLGLKDREIAAVYTAYRLKLKEEGWFDVEGLYRLAVYVLQQEHPVVPWQHLYFSEFYQFDGLQVELLRELKNHCGINVGLMYDGARPEIFAATVNAYLDLSGFLDVEKLNPPLPTRAKALTVLTENLGEESGIAYDGKGIRLLEANTREQEVRTVLRSVKKLLQQGESADDIIILLRDFSFYAGLRRLSDEYGVPVSLPQSAKLNNQPLTELVYLLLKKAVPSVPALDAANLWQVLGCQALKMLFKPDAEKLLRLKADKYYQTTAAFVEDGMTVLDEENKQEFTRLLELAGSLPQSANISDYCNAVSNLLEQLNIASVLGAAFKNGMADHTAIKNYLLAETAITKILTQLQADYEAGGMLHKKINAQDFADIFYEAVQGVELTLQKGDMGGVLITEASGIQGVYYKHVFLLGVREGEFPVLKTENWIYNDYERAMMVSLGIDLPGTIAGLNEDRYFFAAAVSAALQSLTVSWYSDDQGGASAYAEMLQNTFAEGTLKVESCEAVTVENALSANELAEKLAGADRDNEWLAERFNNWNERTELEYWRDGGFDNYSGVLADKNLLTQLQKHLGSSFSASRLETYAACPFKFLVSYLWQQQEYAEADENVTSIDRGNLLHAAAAEFTERYCGKKLTDYALDALQAEMQQIFEKLCEEYLRSGKLKDTVLLPYQKERFLQTLLDFVKAEYAYAQSWQGYTPLAVERAFGPNTDLPVSVDADGAPINLQGRIDRIDTGESGIFVTDYKSGEPPKPAKMEQGFDMQMPLYLLAAQQLGGKVLGGGYYSFKTGKREGGVFFDNDDKPPFYGKNAKAADFNGFISATGEFIKNYVTAMRSGDFKPQAVDGCDYCPACDICRRYGIKAAGGADEDV